jgi:ubiquinone/menaquinone biosynthesis C-methylase UbiE
MSARFAPSRSSPNCTFTVATVNDLPFPDESMDCGYSLGVLHHIPDTSSALAACVSKLKAGAPLLVYSTTRWRASHGVSERSFVASMRRAGRSRAGHTARSPPSQP